MTASQQPQRLLIPIKAHHHNRTHLERHLSSPLSTGTQGVRRAHIFFFAECFLHYVCAFVDIACINFTIFSKKRNGVESLVLVKYSTHPEKRK
jgi:hypothetical protein